jgi:hypothetical protein
MLAAAGAAACLIALSAPAHEAAGAGGTPVRVAHFEQGRGTFLTSKPTALWAERNPRPGATSTRDAWSSLTWRSWGATRATATGTYWYHLPTGDPVPYPAAVTLSRLRTCGRVRIYTRITGVFTKERPADMPRRFTIRTLPYECVKPAVARCAGFRAGPYRATHVRRAGTVPCRTVRSLIKRTYAGKADAVRRPESGRATHIFRGGWRCSTGAGGVGCWNVKRPGLNVIDTRVGGRVAIAADIT